MSLTTTYMQSSKNLDAIFEAIRKAGVPRKFTNEFLKSLGFTSSNDRSVIATLKSLEFLDSNGVPTHAYRELRDSSKWKKVLATQMRKAYEDLFIANTSAHTAPMDRIKGVFTTQTGKDESVVSKMATTFKSLAKLADFSGAEELPPAVPPPVPGEAKIHAPTEQRLSTGGSGLEYHYNIQIHLPVTKDVSVYNAIFKSLREHLL